MGADAAKKAFTPVDQISIHGPRVGADLSVPAVPSSWPHFNPRPPCGGRPPRPAPPRASRGFQSTAPVWGPTVAAALVRLPAEFQSTAPVWGPTHAFVWLPGTAVISIHGPRVGADRCICSPFLQAAYFNPRPPCGGRRQAFPSSRCPVQFQSTAPVWGPTRSSRRKLCFHCNFNPRPPCGGRHTISNNIRLLFEFQSTAPVWGPTDEQRVCKVLVSISIHGPRVGADVRQALSKPAAQISIHGPRVGADSLAVFVPRAGLHFNPRPPCGGRPHLARNTIWLVTFQSTAPVWGPTQRSYTFADGTLFQSTAPVWGPTSSSAA